jgi:uncharacterized protein
MTTTFTPQPNGGVYAINAYGLDYIEVNGVRHGSPLILDPEHGPTPLAPGLTAATIGDDVMAMILSKAPEVVLIGTGNRQVFVSPATLQPLSNRRIGVECMTLAAACRTFNLLAAEGRKTIAVLLFDAQTQTDFVKTTNPQP